MKCRIVTNDGPACKNCGKPMQVRTHKAIKAKQLRQPYYYSQWYYCNNIACTTKQVNPPEFQVWNTNKKAATMKRAAQERADFDTGFIRDLTG